MSESDCGCHEQLYENDPIEKYQQTDGKWVATIWMCRTFYKAEGDTPEDAVIRLKDHLYNIIPILENDIRVAQEKINIIRELLS